MIDEGKPPVSKTLEPIPYGISKPTQPIPYGVGSKRRTSTPSSTNTNSSSWSGSHTRSKKWR